MTLISLTDCCHLLAIDPKTLRRWMSHSCLQTLPSPLDARCKCLTREQLQQLAATHRRTLETQREQPELIQTPSLSTSASTGHPKKPHVRRTPLGMILRILGPFLRWLLGFCLIGRSATPRDVSARLTDLTQQLGLLQVQVATLQHQLALLHAQGQKEQQRRASEVSVSLGSSLENALKSSQDLFLESSQQNALKSSRDLSLEVSPDQSLESSRQESLESSQQNALKSSRDLSKDLDSAPVEATPSSTDQRRRSHVLPLVEYGGTPGKYVVISPERGLLELSPDSPEWFAWLSTLPSFRFVGPLGRFTAHRGGSMSPNRSWRASRHIRNRSFNLSLGKTESLTIVELEQAAAALQSSLD